MFTQSPPSRLQLAQLQTGSHTPLLNSQEGHRPSALTLYSASVGMHQRESCLKVGLEVLWSIGSNADGVVPVASGVAVSVPFGIGRLTNEGARRNCGPNKEGTACGFAGDSTGRSTGVFDSGVGETTGVLCEYFGTHAHPLSSGSALHRFIGASVPFTSMQSYPPGDIACRCVGHVQSSHCPRGTNK